MKIKISSLIIISIVSILFSLKLHADNSWAEAKKGDRIILIRHALAPGGGDPPEFKIDDCSTQRNLNKIGIQQSQHIGRLFRENKIPIDQVLSSQWCRCKDTALYAFENYKEFSALNSTFQPPHDKNTKKQIKELKGYIEKWNGRGGNLILVTHYVIITAITDVTPRSGEIVIIDKNYNTLSTILTN